MLVARYVLLATLAVLADAARVCRRPPVEGSAISAPSKTTAQPSSNTATTRFPGPNPSPSAGSTSPAPAKPSGSLGTAPSGPVAPRPSDCKCGYQLSKHNNAYYPFAKEITFGGLPNGPLSGAGALASKNLIVTDNWGIGGAGPDGTRCFGLPENIKVNNGVLELLVPGGQQKGGQVTGAEMTFNEVVTGGVFTMEARMDPTPGTCQAIFTYAQDDHKHGDEQDIEILSSSIFDPLSNGTPAGVQLNNWDPDSLHTQSDLKIVPFPADPTTAFHNYTIAWTPSGTYYLFDGARLESPTKYFSVHNSNVIINHWTNGDPGFTQGPPTKDVNMKVKSLVFYYQIGAANALPAGCSAQDACVV